MHGVLEGTGFLTLDPRFEPPDATPSDGEVFATCTAGLFDGIRVDREGRLWAAAAAGIHCHDPDRTLNGKVLIPELCSNISFGGAKRNRLLICGTTSLYSVFLTKGSPRSRFLSATNPRARSAPHSSGPCPARPGNSSAGNAPTPTGLLTPASLQAYMTPMS